MERPSPIAVWLFRFASSQRNVDRVAFWLGGIVSILAFTLGVVVLVMLILR